MKTKATSLGIFCATLIIATIAHAQVRPYEIPKIPPVTFTPPIITIPTIPPIPTIPNLTPTGDPPFTGGGTGGGNHDLGQAFVIAVCAGISDDSDDCWNSGVQRATKILIQFYLEEYAKEVVKSSLTVRFPDAASREKQLKFFTEVDKAVLRAVEAKLKADVANLTPFRWDTEEDRQNKQRVVDEAARTVKNWGNNARSEADDSSHWSQTSSSNSYRFEEGVAFRQLKYINIHGWTNQ